MVWRMQMELQHVVSLHLAGGISEEKPAAAVAVSQLFGALQAHVAAIRPGEAGAHSSFAIARPLVAPS